MPPDSLIVRWIKTYRKQLDRKNGLDHRFGQETPAGIKGGHSGPPYDCAKTQIHRGHDRRFRLMDETWRQGLDEDLSIEDISKKAMALNKKVTEQAVERTGLISRRF